MKITFDQGIKLDANEIKGKGIPQESIQPKEKTQKGAVLDLSQGRNRVKEYSEKKKNFADLVEDGGLQGDKLQQMYMAVMSNNMSTEDFAALSKGGYDPTDVTIEDAVTILDTIKIAVAKGGTEVTGFTDDISHESLKDQLGSEAYANALEKGDGYEKALETAAAIEAPDQNQICYMVENAMEPTVENLYLAKHMSQNMFVNEKSIKAEDMLGQVEPVLSRAGLTLDAQNLELVDAFLERSIPVTEENLALGAKIRDLPLPMTKEEASNRLTKGMESGRKPMDVDLSKEKTIYREAAELAEEVAGFTEDLLESIPGDPADTTIAELRQLKKQRLTAPSKKQGENQNQQLVKAQKTLVQVQLKMTVEANFKLLESGYHIDIAPLQTLLDELMKAEEEILANPVMQAKQAVDAVSDFAAKPLYAMGYAFRGEISFTVEAISASAITMQAEFERAGEAYETMMTAPRADLGDSLKKAFGDTDRVITDLGMEVTTESQRAVHILAYNHMEITRESMEEVMESDAMVQNVIRKVTPGVALQMIRDGINPLTVDMRELDEYLNQQEDTMAKEAEKYSSFLYRMEKKGQITEEEKEAYIGVYRLFRQIEKQDGAALGYLLGAGAEINFENLLAATRSRRATGMDYRFDESFQGVDKKVFEESTIDEQLDLMNRVREGRVISEEAVATLQRGEVPPTTQNLLAAEMLMHDADATYRKLQEKAEKGIEEDLDALIEGLDDEASAASAMDRFGKAIEEKCKQVLEQDSTMQAVDVKAMQLMSKQLHVATKLATHEEYYVPVEIDGGYTNIHLTFRHSSTSSVMIQMQRTEGQVFGARFELVKEKKLEGYFFAANAEDEAYLQQIRTGFMSLVADSVELTLPQILRMAEPPKEKEKQANTAVKDTEKQDSKISTENLYQVAKAFVKSVRNQ